MPPAELVLGLNAFTPDPAAALFQDGRLVAFIEEDRLSGNKHAPVWPELAISEVLGHVGASIADVSAAFYGFSPRAGAVGVVRSMSSFASLSPTSVQRRVARVIAQAESAARLVDRLARIREQLSCVPTSGVDHHRSHAAYAFDASSFDDAAILILDSVGEYVATSVSVAHRADNGIRRVRAWSNTSSLPALYGAGTRYLGWRANDEEGTVMALAATGDATRYQALFDKAVRVSERGVAFNPRLIGLRVSRSARYARRFPLLTSEFLERGPGARSPNGEITQAHADFAAALQEKYEQGFLALCAFARRRTRLPHLVIGGGGALNCVAAGLLSASDAFSSVFIPPAPGDSGTAIGAALIGGSLGLTGSTRGFAWGVEATDISHVPGFVRLEHPAADLPAIVAARLTEGALVGICRGRSESGPRALGHRSILASPAGAGVVDDLNARVKQRERFRPFAPVLRSVDRRLVTDDRLSDLRFMSFAIPFREAIPHRRSVVHENGMARAQTVTPQEDPFLWQVLTAFASASGVPYLINTSLNIKGKPLSGSTELAMRAAHEAGLDFLVVNDVLYEAHPRRWPGEAHPPPEAT